MVVPGYLAICGLVLWQVGGRLGTELFPQVDSGEFVLRFRPPPGSNFELTRQMAVKCLEEIEREAKPENIAITMGFVGQVAPNFGIDNMLLFMRGPDDGQLRVALREGSGIKLDEFRERLRKVLPERVVPWLAKRLEQGGVARQEAQRLAATATFGFEPGDIVTEVMSFGSSTPIAVQVIGTDLGVVRQHATKIAGEMKKIPFLRDVQFAQTLDYPSVEVEIDREKAGLSGVTVEDVGKAMILGTSSTRFVSVNYWIDVKTGFDYLVEVLVPPIRMTKAADVETLPIEQVNPPGQPDDPRRGDGPPEHAARRVRPLDVAAVPDADGERRGRGHGPGVAAGGKGDRRGRGAAPRRAGDPHGPAPAHGRDVRGARGRDWGSPCS